MKNTFLSLALVSMLFVSCGEDDTADIIINDNSVTNNYSGGTSDETVLLKGSFTSDLTLDATKNYIIDGPVIMEAGTTLTIPAGMTIRASATGSDVYIAIAQGAKIIADGSASFPIVFTSNSSTPNAGDWGGLIVLGKAPINSVVGGDTTSTSEIASLPYGGQHPDDDSGVIRYVRIEYSGGKADGQSENNGFSFYGVGNGTTVQYIQAYEGLDDGIEFFGGTVNASYISVVNAQDDSVDWTEGFSGTLTNVYVKHGSEHDKGIEADGFNTDIGNNSNPLFFSKPTVENLTIKGLGSGTGNEAVRLRAGTQGIFKNVLIEGFEEAFDLDGDQGDSPTGAGVTSGDLHVTDATFTDIITKLKNDTGVTFTEGDFISGDGNGTGTDYASWGTLWTRQ
ncbi:MAG: multidrug transporter [Flavobacteriaceae bacterium]